MYCSFQASGVVDHVLLSRGQLSGLGFALDKKHSAQAGDYDEVGLAKCPACARGHASMKVNPPACKAVINDLAVQIGLLRNRIGINRSLDSTVHSRFMRQHIGLGECDHITSGEAPQRPGK